MAEAPRSIGYTNQWANPLFATYGSALSLAMTSWLYGDKQSNPFWDQPGEWYRAGRIAFIDRVINFTPGASATPQVVTANVGGGKNVLVFSRSAVVKRDVVPGTFTPVPNELSDYITVQIRRQDGFIDQETAPVNNNYGVAGRPFIRPAPEFWLGNQSREFTLINTSGIAVTVSLVFQIALLDTGR